MPPTNPRARHVRCGVQRRSSWCAAPTPGSRRPMLDRSSSITRGPPVTEPVASVRPQCFDHRAAHPLRNLVSACGQRQSNRGCEPTRSTRFFHPSPTPGEGHRPDRRSRRTRAVSRPGKMLSRLLPTGYPGIPRKLGDQHGCQKVGWMLCSHAIRRASSVVTNGFLLTCTSREAQKLSFRINGAFSFLSYVHGPTRPSLRGFPWNCVFVGGA